MYILGGVALDCDKQHTYTAHTQVVRYNVIFFPIFSCSYHCYRALFLRLRSMLEPALVDLGSTAHPPLVTAKFTFILPPPNSEADVSMGNSDLQGDPDLGPPLKRTRQQLIFRAEERATSLNTIEIVGVKRKRVYMTFLGFVANVIPSNHSSAPSFSTPISEPSSYAQAMRSMYHKQWHNASQLQVSQLEEQSTWIFKSLPSGCTPLRGRWVYKVKYDVNGKIACFKACWIVCGDLQREGVDFNETATAVAHATVVRMLIALAARHNQHLQYFDFVTAFLNGYMDPSFDIYVEQPHGFVQKETSGTLLYCLFQKALYGLKQAPLLWYQRLTSYLSDKLYFTPFSAEVCLYRRGQTYILIYVDDLLIMAPSGHLIDEILSIISGDFNITSLGPVAHFLGMRVIREGLSHITLLQDTYVAKLLAEFSFIGGSRKSVSTPMDSAIILDKTFSNPLSEAEHSTFLRLNGSL